MDVNANVNAMTTGSRPASRTAREAVSNDLVNMAPEGEDGTYCCGGCGRRRHGGHCLLGGHDGREI